MNLSDYHRLRSQEEHSWNRQTLRAQAGSAFVGAVEPLLPAHAGQWTPLRYSHVQRDASFEDSLQICDLYTAATESQRTWLRSRVDRAIGGALTVFGLHAAILAAREHSEPLARAALIAFAIADLVDGDIRDVLIGFTLVCHCAGLSGADLPALLREVAELAGLALQTLYREWAELYPNLPTIGSMWWREIQTPDGVGFLHG